MNMNFKFLLLWTSLSLIPNLLYAQCTTTPDCAAMGYKETANKGGCLKCPTGNGWYCPEPKEEKAVLGECTGYAKNCSVGQILNSDGTCTTDKVSGKTPIGVVVYIGGDNCGYAMTASPIRTGIRWSTSYITTGIGATTSWQTAIKNFDACANTQKIIQQGSSSEYPAAWAAVNYVPSSAPTTKGKWCLPAGGIARSMMNNYDKINSGLLKAEGELLPELSEHNRWNWSSSEFNYFCAWHWDYASNKLHFNFVNSSYVKTLGWISVRPVIEF